MWITFISLLYVVGLRYPIPSNDWRPGIWCSTVSLICKAQIQRHRDIIVFYTVMVWAHMVTLKLGHGYGQEGTLSKSDTTFLYIFRQLSVYHPKSKFAFIHTEICSIF